MAEGSRALRSGRSLLLGVGSNSTPDNTLTFFSPKIMFVPSKSITPFGLELDTFWLHSAAQTEFIAWLPRCRILTVFFPMDIPYPARRSKGDRSQINLGSSDRRQRFNLRATPCKCRPKCGKAQKIKIALLWHTDRL